MLSCDENGSFSELTDKIRENRFFNYMGNISETDLFFKIAENTSPDIIIIDFEKLTFDDIEKIGNLKSDASVQKIIILSKSFSEIHLQSLLSDIADFLIYKPYTADVIISTINEAVFSIENGFSPGIFSDTSHSEINKFLQNKITEIIRLAGIPAHIMGYNYLRTAVMKCTLDMDIFPITKKLYPQLATEFETTSQKVECAIRHAIDVGWSRSEEKTMKNIFGYSFHSKKSKPTNREFIAMVADNIKIENSNVIINYIRSLR